MQIQLQSCLRVLIVPAVACLLLSLSGGCVGGNSDKLQFKPPEMFHEAKKVEMTLPATVMQGESPEISVRLQMSEEMASLLPEKGYVSLFPLGNVDSSAPPGQMLMFSAYVYYSAYSDDSKDVEIDAAFPGFFKPYPLDVDQHVSYDPFARDLAPGMYNVYARIPTAMDDDPMEYFGSFEVLSAE